MVVIVLSILLCSQVFAQQNIPANAEELIVNTWKIDSVKVDEKQFVLSEENFKSRLILGTDHSAVSTEGNGEKNTGTWQYDRATASVIITFPVGATSATTNMKIISLEKNKMTTTVSANGVEAHLISFLSADSVKQP